MINPDRNLYEPPYDDALLYESDLEPERPRSRPLVVLLGIVVLAAFAGVVWVAYNQGVKQGQRGVPILTADSGPTRITPEATNDGQSSDPAPDKSYDRLLGDAPEQEDNILPAPEQPRVVPAPQDLASNETEAGAPTGGPFQSKATDIDPPMDPRMDSTVGVENLTPAVPAAGVLSAPSESEDISAAVPRQITPKPTTAKPAVAESMPAKPVRTAPSVAEAAPPPAEAPPVETKMAALPPAEAPAPKPAVPAPVAGGSVMIQLGSFPNDGLAASAWSKIKMANQDLLGSYSPSIKSADIPGKGTWYRLRVGGFADKASARGVCEQLKANGQACILALK